MERELLSFLFFFCVGLGVSLQPGTVMAGIHISRPLQGDGKRWIAFGLLSLIMLLGDMVMMHFLQRFYENPSHVLSYMHMMSSDIISGGIILLLALVILQLAGIVDFTHGERNLRFYYEQMKQELVTPTWEERYVQSHAGSLLSCVMSLIYMLRAPFRSSWPYVLWALGCKLVVILINVLLLPMVAQWPPLAHLIGGEVALLDGGTLWVDTYIFTYLMVGYLCGHVVFHYDESRLHSVFVMVLRLFSHSVVIISSLLCIAIIAVLSLYGR